MTHLSLFAILFFWVVSTEQASTSTLYLKSLSLFTVLLPAQEVFSGKEVRGFEGSNCEESHKIFSQPSQRVAVCEPPGGGVTKSIRGNN